MVTNNTINYQVKSLNTHDIRRRVNANNFRAHSGGKILFPDILASCSKFSHILSQGSLCNKSKLMRKMLDLALTHTALHFLRARDFSYELITN